MSPIEHAHQILDSLLGYLGFVVRIEDEDGPGQLLDDQLADVAARVAAHIHDQRGPGRLASNQSCARSDVRDRVKSCRFWKFLGGRLDWAWWRNQPLWNVS